MILFVKAAFVSFCASGSLRRFLIDRAGYVGPDGSTHHGTFDLAFLGCVPDLVVMAPSDELELLHMVEVRSPIIECAASMHLLYVFIEHFAP